MLPGLSLTSLGVSAGGIVAYGGSSGLMDGLSILCALSAFVFICSVEAALAS